MSSSYSIPDKIKTLDDFIEDIKFEPSTPENPAQVTYAIHDLFAKLTEISDRIKADEAARWETLKGYMRHDVKFARRMLDQVRGHYDDESEIAEAAEMIFWQALMALQHSSRVIGYIDTIQHESGDEDV